MSDSTFSQHDILPEPQPVPQPKPSRIVALWIGIVALLAGGVFGAVYLAGEDEGSPEDAVQRMFDAIENEDVLGVVSALAPSERDAFVDNLPGLTKELERLEILSDDFDLNKVDGVDLSFDGLKFSSRDIADGVSAVRITGGTARYKVRPQELPLGRFVTDLIGEELPSDEQSGSDAVSNAEDDEPIVAIREDGRWYVSLNYSIAESMRQDAGAPVPPFGNGLQAKGAASPEDAVRELVQSGLRLDVRRVIQLMPPDEGKVLRDYAPLFLDDLERNIRDVGFSAQLKNIDLDTNRDGSHASVAIKGFEVAFSTEGDTGSVAYDGKCVTLSGPDVAPEDSRVCPEDAEGFAAFEGFASRLPAQGLVVVERDGQWYVSPTRTVLESLTGALRAMQRSDLDKLRDFFQGMTVGEEQFVESSLSG